MCTQVRLRTRVRVHGCVSRECGAGRPSRGEDSVDGPETPGSAVPLGVRGRPERTETLDPVLRLGRHAGHLGDHDTRRGWTVGEKDSFGEGRRRGVVRSMGELRILQRGRTQERVVGAGRRVVRGGRRGPGLSRPSPWDRESGPDFYGLPRHPSTHSLTLTQACLTRVSRSFEGM